MKTAAAVILVSVAGISLFIAGFALGEGRGREQALEIICRAAFLGEYVNGTCRF